MSQIDIFALSSVVRVFFITVTRKETKAVSLMEPDRFHVPLLNSDGPDTRRPAPEVLHLS